MIERNHYVCPQFFLFWIRSSAYAQDYGEGAFKPELPDVVVTCLPVSGANDAHAVAGLDVPELQQHNSQVVDKQLGIHEGHGELNDAVVVLILLSPHHKQCKRYESADIWMYPLL